MTSDSLAPALRRPALLATPGYLRLWFAGRGGRQRCVGVGDPGASVLRIDRNLEKIRE